MAKDAVRKVREVKMKDDQDYVMRDTGEKGWLGVEFSGYEPDDQRSSLLRRWVGTITATRSDGEVIKVPIVSMQGDTPQRIGADLIQSFQILESYRNCDCTAKTKCDIHDTRPEDHAAAI